MTSNYLVLGFSDNDLNINSDKSIIDNAQEDITPEPSYKISRIIYDGNKLFKQNKLNELFRWIKVKEYNLEEIRTGIKNIVQAYKKNGFVFVLVVPKVILNSEHNNNISLIVSISEGKRLRFGDLNLLGNELFSNSILIRQLNLKKGQYFTQTILEKGIERIQLFYSEHGYPMVEIEPSNINLIADTSTINFDLKIREGKKVRLSGIEISGLKKTKKNVVLREIPIKVDDIFDQRKIDQSYHRLRNLGYFNYIDPNLLDSGPTDDTVQLHAKVNEARTGRLILILGYAPPVVGSESIPKLTGVVEMNESNLMGSGREVNFFWKSGLLNTLTIGYKEPWILGKPIKLGGTYSQLKQHNTNNEVQSEEQSASISANSTLSNYYESDVVIGYKRINFTGFIPPVLNTTPIQTPPSTILTSSSQPTSIESGTKYSVTVRITRDSRDYFLNPTRGRRDSIAVELSKSEFRLRKIWLDLQQYHQTWENQIVAIELHGAIGWGINIPPTELFYLGGTTTLRGYDEDWFSGPRILYGNIEYRFLVGRNSQLFTFLDLGTVSFIDRPSVFDTLRIGYGFGARLESKGGIIQLDYGLAAGESALKGKIHVKLGASF